jgi:hypothetical protein
VWSSTTRSAHPDGDGGRFPPRRVQRRGNLGSQVAASSSMCRPPWRRGVMAGGGSLYPLFFREGGGRLLGISHGEAAFPLPWVADLWRSGIGRYCMDLCLSHRRGVVQRATTSSVSRQYMRRAAVARGDGRFGGESRPPLRCPGPLGRGSNTSWAGKVVHPGIEFGAARASGGLHGGGRGVHDFSGFSLGGGLAPVLKRWWSWVTLVVRRVRCCRRLGGLGVRWRWLWVNGSRSLAYACGRSRWMSLVVRGAFGERSWLVEVYAGGGSMV